MRFLDTNIFLRHLTHDDAEKGDACTQLFMRLNRGSAVATTCEAVIAEIVYVLSSRSLYGLSRARVRDSLAPVLAVPGLRLADKRVYLSALDLFAESNLDFEDALFAAHMERVGETELYSYDHGFDHLPSITRLEP